MQRHIVLPMGNIISVVHLSTKYFSLHLIGVGPGDFAELVIESPDNVRETVKLRSGVVSFLL
jgi:hypothetical protein